MERRTRVAIIGAGPAGLVLANVLTRAGVDCVVVEHRSREHVESRARAGFLEHRTVEYLTRHGLADRLLAEAMRHVRCEFRTGGRRFSVPYGELAGGRAHAVYPQQFLVRDLIELLTDAGGEVLFSTPVAEVTGLHERRATLASPQGTITCDFVAGCDGHRGVSRQAVPEEALRTFTKRYPFDWLAVLGEARPAPEQVVYALHENGFAGQMPRTADVSRFYLQCPAGDSVEQWPDERIWKELGHRLEADGVAALTTGRILEKGILSMRSAVTEPMQFGRLFLAGDAAHVLTPSGAKGMNLAIADAAALAEAIIAHYRDGVDDLLAGYSSTRLPDVWQAQEFSDWLVQLLHGPEDPGDGFQQRLREARLAQLEQSSVAATAFAHRYVG
jgi:p-hydroxybenzoate 3-monooxygenase